MARKQNGTRGTGRGGHHHPQRGGDAGRSGRQGGDLPEGTATDAPAPENTSIDAPPVQGVHRPDMGPGGTDLDEGDRVLTNRARTARGPQQPSAPEE